MPKNSIRLHPEHGLNPKLVVCRFCNRETGEIALPGAAIKDDGRYVVVDPWPCKKCHEDAAAHDGVILVECTKPPSEGGEATGRMMILGAEAIRGMFSEPYASKAVEQRMALMDEEAYQRIVEMGVKAGVMNPDGTKKVSG